MVDRQTGNSRHRREPRIRKELEGAWNDIQRLAGEVRLQIHLGGMDVKDRWRALEPRIQEFESRAAQASEEAVKGLEEIAKAIAVDLEILRDGLGRSRTIEPLMHAPPIVCRATDTLARAAGLMWDHDIGIVLVIGTEGGLAGVITDRDIAMATYTKGRAPGEIPVADAMAKEIFTCRASDSIGVAEWLMAEHRIRRLPVVDAHGHAVGVLSMNDLVRDAQKSKNDDRQRGIVQTLAAICAPRLRATEPESAPLEPHTHA